MEKPELQVGVKCILKNFEGKILLLKRSEEKYSHKDLWDIPGGRITPGSSLLENLNREIKEETNLTLKSEPILIAAQDIMLPEKHVVRLTYVADIDGQPELDDEEHVDFGWFDLDELRIMKDLDKFVKELLDNNILTERTLEGD